MQVPSITQYQIVVSVTSMHDTSQIDTHSNQLIIYIGLSAPRQRSIYATAIGVLILVFCRLFMECHQLITQHWRYLIDWVNWLEWCLFICSIIFVWVFHTDCLCVLEWQWQVGIAAVFLSWMGLINFVSKLPYIGIYVIMFFEIFKTVLKLIIFSFLLVIGFGLAFYMTFFEPGITVWHVLNAPYCCMCWSLVHSLKKSV